MMDAEFKEMAKATLGAGFDEDKLEQIQALQTELRASLASLYKQLSLGSLAKADYLNLNSEAQRITALRCEAVLGADGFIKLFGIPAAEAGRVIDPALAA
ncbi:hypothetical protein ACLB1G_13685 [Oxalobacteraceae bacterium A2-2]